MRLSALFILLFATCSLFAVQQSHVHAHVQQKTVHAKGRTRTVTHEKQTTHQKTHADDDSLPQPYDTSHNKFYRSYVDQGDVAHVDPFTGNMTMHIPIIDVPGNDGLALKFYLSFNTRLNEIHDLNQEILGYGWYFYSAEYDPTQPDGLSSPIVINPPPDPNPPNPQPPFNKPQSYYNPVFIDPTGKTHHFYQVTQTDCDQPNKNCIITYLTSDNWTQTITIGAVSDPGATHAVITSPDGTQYNLSPQGNVINFLLKSITSPNKGTTITYNYDSSDFPCLQSIVLSSSSGYSYTVNLNYATKSTYYGDVNVLQSISTSDSRRWSLNYSDFLLHDGRGDNIPTLTSLTLPNGTSWQFSPINVGYTQATLEKNNGQNPRALAIQTITSPKGLITNLSYANNFAPDSSNNVNLPLLYDRISIPYVTKKVLTGPHIVSSTWNYTLTAGTEGDDGLQLNPTTVIQGPDSKIIDTFNVDRNNFGAKYLTLYSPMTGILEEHKIYNTAGNLMQDTQYVWGQRTISQYIPSIFDQKDVTRGQPMQNMYVPELQSKTITYGGSRYTTAYSDFDQYGYPATINSSSPQGSYIKKLTYYEDPSKNIFKTQNEKMTNTSGDVVNTITRAFDSNGNMTNETDNGVSTSYAYDGSGNITSKTDASGYVTTYSNYIAGLPGSVVDPMGNKTTTTVQPNGTITSITDPMGKITNYSYGPLYRLTGITPPINAATTLKWVDNSSGTTMTMTRGGHVTTVQYNPMGKPISTVSTGGTSSSAVYSTYDALNRLLSKSFVVASGTSSPANTTFTYDALGRILTATQTGGYETHYAYDDVNNTETITDPNGHATTEKFRSFGDPTVKQLMEIDQPGGINTVIARTIMGQVTSIIQNGHVRSYSYDAHHFLTGEVNPETGNTTYQNNAVGKVISKQDENMPATTYSYDKDYHLITTKYQDNGAQSIVRTYDPNGRLTNITNSQNKSAWAYTYDANNNMLSQTLSIDGKTFPFTYTYDTLDHIATATYPDSTKLTYTVNPAGQITAVAPYLSNITYFPDNHIQSFEDGSGVTTTYTENPRNMRDSVIVSKGDTKFLNKSYVYDGVGNISSITDNLNNTNNQTMTYDGINRLIEAKGSWGDEKFTYDINSNILSKTIGTATSTYNYDPHTDLLMNITGANAQSFRYVDGDTTSIGKINLTYNPLHQTKSMNGIGIHGAPVNDTYSYDGNGNRVYDNENNSINYEAYNQAAQLLFKTNTTNNSEDFYIHIGNQSAVHLHKQGTGPLTPEYLHNNLLGSALVATDSNAASKWQQLYKPFGNELVSNPSRSNTHLGFTGKPHDNVSGLSYYGARYYSPDIGRFLSMDPAPVDASNPMSFNRYAYANNNPYRYTDPTGKEAKDDAGSTSDSGDSSSSGGLGGSSSNSANAPDSSANSDDDSTKNKIINVAVMVIGSALKGVVNFAGFVGALDTGGGSVEAAAAEDASISEGENALEGAISKDLSDEKNVSTGFKGSRKNELSNGDSITRNQRTTINGREYTGHGLDQMQNRGITPSVVEDTINKGDVSSGYDGATVYTTDQARVITNEDGSVKTVYHQ